MHLKGKYNIANITKSGNLVIIILRKTRNWYMYVKFTKNYVWELFVHVTCNSFCSFLKNVYTYMYMKCWETV